MPGVKEFVEGVVEALYVNPAVDPDEVRGHVEQLMSGLERASQQTSDEPVHERVETARDLLHEAYELYYRSLEGILEFLEVQDESLLPGCVFAAEEASDILAAAQDLIQANKDTLSHMSAA